MNQQAFEIKEKLASLDSALTEKLPGIFNMLRDIHTLLKKNPDCVTVLTEEECSVLVRGLKKQTAMEILTTSMKQRKSRQKVTVDDL